MLSTGERLSRSMPLADPTPSLEFNDWIIGFLLAAVAWIFWCISGLVILKCSQRPAAEWGTDVAVTEEVISTGSEIEQKSFASVLSKDRFRFKVALMEFMSNATKIKRLAVLYLLFSLSL